MKNQSNQYTIYIGLNDRQTGKQVFDTDKYLSVLKNVCYNYQVAFSVHVLNGGYFHKDGRFVAENTLSLVLVNIEENIVIEIAKDLCAFFNQESVMVTSSPMSTFFVEESLE